MPRPSSPSSSASSASSAPSGSSASPAHPALALGLMALGATLFALMNFLARIASVSSSWTTVAAVRAIIGALVAYAVARSRGRSIAARDKRAIFWRSLFGTFSMLATFYALSSRTVSLGDTVTLLNLAPVFLAVLAPIFLREPTSPVVALAIAVALTGVVFVVRPTFLFGGAHLDAVAGLPGPSAGLTAGAAVLAAASTSIAMMMLRRAGRTEGAEAIAFHFSVFAAVTMSILSLFDLRLPSARDLACMVGAGLCAGVAQLAMTRAYTLENAARVSGMSYLSVVASAILGVGLLHEHPGPTAAVGMTLVVAGGILVTSRRRAR